MEEIIKGLLSAGYQVRMFPGQYDKNSPSLMPSGPGFTVVIHTSQYMTHGNTSEKWEAYAETPDRALKMAAIALRDHIRPAYDGYVSLANKLGWEK